MPRIIYITGVSGVGKSTIGQSLAKKLGLPFLEGDDYHPKVNIEKMSTGQPLNDEDRAPWLTAIKNAATENALLNGAIISCSALKNKYRAFLAADFASPIDWVHLQLEKNQIAERLSSRDDHFMSADLLDSQFAAFETPNSGLLITNDAPPEIIVNRIIQQLPASLGIIGLGVMGKSLCRNFANKGQLISMFNREAPPHEIEVAKKFQAAYPELENAKAFNELPAFLASLQKPRRILLMVSAGTAVDILIGLLQPHLSPGDCIIDAGNSHFSDTERRTQELNEAQIGFIGMGVSGGEKGALEGPAMMPGGSSAAFELINIDFQKIAAKDNAGNPCFAHVGKAGAGHFVKMVHNGIEYAEMQLIAELVTFLTKCLQMDRLAISALFDEWNQGPTQSYLLEITAKILLKKDGDDWLLDKILDKAESKGTGNWTVKAAAELGVPLPMINAAVTARYFSMYKKERVQGSTLSSRDQSAIAMVYSSSTTSDLRNAYQIARAINHQQGLHLIQVASDQFHWNVNLQEVTRIWTNGCIIRSALMVQLSEMGQLQPFVITQRLFPNEVTQMAELLQKLNIIYLQLGISNPCFQAAWEYYNQFTQANSTANIIQAQRDFFGAHTYRRIDQPLDQSFHTDWEA